MNLNNNILRTFTDPLIWCESYLRDPRDREKKLILRSYQKEVLENSRQHKNMILQWGRRMGKSVVMCSDCLWWACIYPYVRMIENKDDQQKPFRVIVCAPYESQIRELWKTFAQLIGDSPLLKDMIARITSSDMCIHFKGHGDQPGSIISGHTVGVTSANQGTSLRGLCLSGDTRVTLSDGTTKLLKNIKIGDMVLSYNEKYEKFLEDKVMLVADPQEKELFEVKFQSGKKVQASLEHKFLSKNGWKKLKDLKVNDLIKSSFNFNPKYTDNALNENHIKLCAYLIGDGCVSKKSFENSRIRFTNSNEKIIQDYKECLTNLDLCYHESYKKHIINKKVYDISVTGFLHKQEKFHSFLKKYELINKIHNTKYIPEIIKKSSLDSKAMFLRHLFSTDGWCCLHKSKENYNQVEVGYCSTSYTLVQDIQDLLYEFGIYSLISTKTYYDNNKNKKIKHQLALRSKSNILAFLTKIGYIFGKEENCLKVHEHVKKGVYSDRINPNYDKIISISSVGIKKCYDITVKNNHNFIANGLIVHNSADLIFIDEMDFIPSEIIEQVILPISSTHDDVKMRICSTPSGKRELYYKFCVNAQKAGWFHTHYPSWHEDNDNWLSIEDAIKQGRPVTDSSEFQFKQVTTSDAYAREYGAEFGEEFGGVYKHSLLERAMHKYGRDINLNDPDIFDPGFKQNPQHKYVMGVDWNSYINGGQVVIVEYCSTPTFVSFFHDEENEDVSVDFTGKYRLFYRRGIKSKEATQRMTREEIIRLMKKWKIDYLYVDYGAGDTNIEELSLYGRDHPELELNKKLRVVDSGSTVEHYDHVLQKPVKKRVKSLMVNFSVLSLEEGMFLLPREEDAQTRLVGQMRSYVIKNITSRGDYTYEGEDHVLDAFNLAIYGFQQNYGQLLQSRINYNINVLNDPRAGLYPNRTTIEKVNSPIAKSHSNSFGMSNRDPDKPPARQVPHRVWNPQIGSRTRFSKGIFGRGSF